MAEHAGKAVLHNYLLQNPGFAHMYETAHVDTDMVREIAAQLPAAHVAVICEYWCVDCGRHVARLAKIADLLPRWSFEVLAWDNATHNRPWRVHAIPTFVVFDGERELGRVVENPRYGSIEEDILTMILGQGQTQARTQEQKARQP